MVLKRVQFRLYPTKSQQVLIEQNFSLARKVYNFFLEYSTKQYELNGISVNYGMMCSVLTQLKRQEQFSYLNEADSIALQQSLRDLHQARQNFFKYHSRYPHFKSRKRSKACYRTICKQDRFYENRIKLPKIGYVKTKVSLDINNIQSITVKRTASGEYFVSVLYEAEPQPLPLSLNNVGIDVGLKSFLTDSNGKVVPNSRFYEKALKRLAREQHRLSRKVKGSKNYEKQRRRLAIRYEKVVNCRNDFLHKLSLDYIRDNQTVCVEDLNVKGMLRNHKLASHIASVAWSTFFEMLRYKALWYGRNFVEVPKFYASSQLCFVCGYKNLKVKNLDVRHWICPSCHTSRDRDFNAARNILRKGLEMLSC